MKRLALLICLCPGLCCGLERDGLDNLLAAAAGAEGKAYISARQTILDLGTNALPALAQVATAIKSSWQQRLVARICYERMTSENDISALRSYNWLKDPRFDASWIKDHAGPQYGMSTLAKAVLTDRGLWYYYTELLWKRTGELSINPFDKRINVCWMGWCAGALEAQSEYFYLRKVMLAQLAQDRMLSEPGIYSYLALRKEPDAVPFLVERVARYVKVTGPSILTPDEIERSIKFRMKEYLVFADSRHADLIEKFISEHPALASLKDKVAEIRKRPAPPPQVEPPFRLGQQLVNP